MRNIPKLVIKFVYCSNAPQIFYKIICEFVCKGSFCRRSNQNVHFGIKANYEMGEDLSSKTLNKMVLGTGVYSDEYLNRSLIQLFFNYGLLSHYRNSL